MGWLLHGNTGTLRKQGISLSCSVLPPDSYVTVKAFSRNIVCRANPEYTEKIILEVPVSLSYQSLPSYFGKEKLIKCS